jgi:hypothetical protein
VRGPRFLPSCHPPNHTHALEPSKLPFFSTEQLFLCREPFWRFLPCRRPWAPAWSHFGGGTPAPAPFLIDLPAFVVYWAVRLCRAAAAAARFGDWPGGGGQAIQCSSSKNLLFGGAPFRRRCWCGGDAPRLFAASLWRDSEASLASASPRLESHLNLSGGGDRALDEGSWQCRASGLRLPGRRPRCRYIDPLNQSIAIQLHFCSVIQLLCSCSSFSYFFFLLGGRQVQATDRQRAAALPAHHTGHRR